eukprot:SAG31_NODE_3979_length_3700_cov_8.705915_1_plen_59_part_10
MALQLHAHPPRPCVLFRTLMMSYACEGRRVDLAAGICSWLLVLDLGTAGGDARRRARRR